MEEMESQCKSLSRQKSSILDNNSKMITLAPIMADITTRTTETTTDIRTSMEMVARKITIMEEVSKITTSTTMGNTNTITRITKEEVNGRIKISNRCITTMANRWTSLLPTKVNLTHFIQIRISLRIQCKMCRSSTLSQTRTPIAFIHDKFITVTSSKTSRCHKSNQLLVALDKCPPMVSIFQLTLLLLVLLVPLHRPHIQTI